MTRKQWLLLLLSVAGVAVIALIYTRGPRQTNSDAGPAPAAPQQSASSGYVDPAVCSSCHQEIARTYSLTGMARSFSKVNGSEFKTPVSFYHKPSDRHYTSVERGGRFYQRRHQIGFDGREANVLEVEAQYVIGSGNHARTLVHRRADGRLVQLAVSWYAERQGYWAMSPGYDRPAHLDFRRVIDAGCMSCHNGYPRAPVEHDPEGPRFAEPLPLGIDCQRCHGPGQTHVEAVKRNDLEAALRTIVNPGKLDRERQLEACMQCHLETTSALLPFQVQRYEHLPFSYTPGKALGDYFIHFDHAPGTGHDDKFEIAGGAYRLRKSACFQRSEMTCVTCHNPHDVPRGQPAVDRYVATCKGCHQTTHRNGTPQVRGIAAGSSCIDCHMPKRRAEDAVHVVMTDHFIQRQPPARDLLAARTEAQGLEHSAYRGEVALYYPQKLAETPDNELYQAVAQVRQGSNMTSGIPRLQQAIERHRPQRAEFYYELGRAYAAAGDHDASIRWSEQALARDGAFAPALKQLATAAMARGEMSRASQTLEKVIALRRQDANALADLGNVYLQQGRNDLAYATAQRALALDASLPRANNTIGLAALRKGVPEDAERYFREAIRQQPDLAEAHNNLGNLLASRNAYPEAAHHFAKAIAIDPAYVAARHSYGVVLALMRSYPNAVVELSTVVRMAPHLTLARLDLADALAALGRVNEAAREFTIAARGDDAAVRDAAQAGLRALGR